MAVDVGEAVVASSVAKRQAFVVHAEQMQERCMEVVHVDLVLSDGRSQFVGASVGDAALGSAAGKPR